MNEKVKQALSGILQRFEAGDIPEAIAYSTFPTYDVPSAYWSLMNRVLMFIAGTKDARGCRQWEKVKRYVKKGAKSFSILAPRLIMKETNKDSSNNGQEYSEEVDGKEEKKVKILTGFLAVPVFRVEDTEGEPLSYEKIQLLDLPLMDVASWLGVTVKGVPWDWLYYGYFDQREREIALATDEETIFFHELSHAAHQKIIGEKLKGDQDWKQEVLAELSAAVLCHLFEKSPSRCLGNNYRYISRYAKEAGLTPVQGCFRVIKDVEDVLNLIFRYVPSGEGVERNEVQEV